MDNLEEVTNKEFNRRRLGLAGASYSIAAVLPLVLSFILAIVVLFVCGPEFAKGEYPDWYIYVSFLLPQLCIAATAAFYFKMSGERVKEFVGRCKIRYFFIAFLLEFGLFFSLSEVSNFFVWVLDALGYKESGIPMPDVSGWRVLPAIFVIALLPAVFEETLFRGILARNMHAAGWGTAATLLITGGMFALFHGNPEQTVYQFLCGVCFTLVTLRAGSILPTMLAHFLNNAIILILTALGYGEFSDFGNGWMYALFAVGAACLLGTLIYLIFFDKSNGGKGKIKGGSSFFVAASIGISILAAEWFFMLVSGFLSGALS